MVSVRPMMADLNCAIEPEPVGARSEPMVIAGSVSSTDHSGTDDALLMAKLGLRTTLSLLAHAASIWA